VDANLNRSGSATSTRTLCCSSSAVRDGGSDDGDGTVRIREIKGTQITSLERMELRDRPGNFLPAPFLDLGDWTPFHGASRDIVEDLDLGNQPHRFETHPPCPFNCPTMGSPHVGRT